MGTMSILPSMRRRGALAVFAALCCGTGSAQVPAEVASELKAIGRVVDVTKTASLYKGRVLGTEARAGITIERDLRYGSDERNVLDVFAPAGGSSKPLPVLIYIPGGGFTASARRVPDSPFFDSLMVWAVRSGMVAVNVNYRVVPASPWPAAADDVGMAVRWVHEQIGARGGDPQRVFLLGHSAGAAHVASYIADRRFHQVSGSGVVGVLLLSGFYRLTPETVGAQGPRKIYFGDDAATYEERSAQRGLVTMAGRLPFWLAFAELDPPPTVSQAEGLNEALCNAGHCPTFVQFPKHSHMSEMFSIGTADRTVSDSMLEFMRLR